MESANNITVKGCTLVCTVVSQTTPRFTFVVKNEF